MDVFYWYISCPCSPFVKDSKKPESRGRRSKSGNFCSEGKALNIGNGGNNPHLNGGGGGGGIQR